LLNHGILNIIADGYELWVVSYELNNQNFIQHENP